MDLSAIWNYTFDTWAESQVDKYYQALLAHCQVIADKPKCKENIEYLSLQFGYVKKI